MRKVLWVLAVLGLCATEAAAQYYPPAGVYRPSPAPDYGAGQRHVQPAGAWRTRRPYDWCQANARRLRDFDAKVQTDGRVSRDEARIAQSLQTDLATSCSRGRRPAIRSWHYQTPVPPGSAHREHS